MAGIDSTTTPFVWPGSGTAVVEDGGANTCTFTLEGAISWEEPGREYVEAMQRRRHQGTPVLLETDDGNITITMEDIKVTSFKGSSNVHPYEALTFTGNAAAWTTVASGTKKAVKLTLTAPHPGGSSQTIVFNFCVPTDKSVNLDGDGGLATFSVTLVDHENAPTIT